MFKDDSIPEFPEPATDEGLTAGAHYSLSAPQKICTSLPDTFYLFLFWNVDSVVHTTATIPKSELTVPSSDFTCTAWYLYVTGGSGDPGYSFFSFDSKKDTFLQTSPVSSANPSTAWLAGSNFVSSKNAAAAVSLKTRLPDTMLEFRQRYILGGGTSPEPSVELAQGTSGIIFAFYKTIDFSIDDIIEIVKEWPWDKIKWPVRQIDEVINVMDEVIRKLKEKR
jgi:hypothetical protein